MILKKIIIGFCLVTSALVTMEKPESAIVDWQYTLMKDFVEAEKNNDFNYLTSRKDYILERVIPLAHAFIDNPREFEILRKKLNMPQAELTQRLYNVINYAKRALGLSARPEESVSDKPVAPSFISKPINPIKEHLSHKMRFLYNFIEAVINGDPDNYINTRPVSTYEIVIQTANNVIGNNKQLELFQNAFAMSEKQIKELITTVTKKAREALIEQASNKSKEVKSQEEKKSPVMKPAPQTMNTQSQQPNVQERINRLKIFSLHDYINEQLSSNKAARSDFIRADTTFIIDRVLNDTNIALNDDELLAMLQKDHNISRPKLITVLEKIRLDILDELKERTQKELPVSEKASLRNEPWPEHPHEPEYEQVEGISIVNKSSQLVTVLVPKGLSSFEIEKVLPNKSSKQIELSRKQTHLILPNGNYIIAPKEGMIELSKEILIDKKGGNTVEPYTVNGLIEEFTFKRNGKKSRILFTINPNLSIKITQEEI